MQIDIPDTWQHVLNDELNKPYFHALEQFVDSEIDWQIGDISV